jgi:trigger factor
MVIDHAIDHIFQNAIRKENLIPVAQAEVVEIISESPLKFVINVEVLPVATINEDYKKIKLPKLTLEVSDDELNNALETIQEKFTKFEDQDENYEIQN